ncbi:DUF742 domain-containing protein [Streptomyces sp. NBC_01808]|uniref:DUF742 domain-containing protein n=1 Tax=Streptomyces sp. NBC_01808 TaxID=2975947 RepID=UPI002DD8C9A6|nr:DUF742 domain-containing protein [Streptomyces sp. NBC_01808]WSA40880.1 DUF742 domain-containing protein [Streptomyces sp. NBC_01808]
MAAHQEVPHGGEDWRYGYGPQSDRPGMPPQHGMPPQPGAPGVPYAAPGVPSSPGQPQHPSPSPYGGDPAHRGSPAPAPQPQPAAAARGARAARSPQSRLVRPYAVTGGRTRPRYQLAIEALVQTTADPSRLTSQLPEHQRICRLCYELKSVAEVSALLTLPLGVARILVADLAEAGLVTIHQPGGGEAAGGQPDVTLLERVLSGLRKL